MVIDFKKEPIEKFVIEMGVYEELRKKYMPGVGAGRGLKVAVEPMFLTMVVEKHYIR